jgi:hypothetical protein
MKAKPFLGRHFLKIIREIRRMAKGGARNGAGRPKGGITQRTRQVAEKLALTGP